MRRTTLVALAVLAAVIAAPASGDVYSRKHSVDAQLSALHARIADAQREARQLSAQIDSVSSQIQNLASRVGDVSARLATLENDLALHRRKLDRLTVLYRLETKRYFFLRREYSLALARLNARLVEVYEQGNADSVDVILGAGTLSDLVDGLNYVNQVGAADERIATSVGRAKGAARAARAETRKLRAVVAAATRAV